MDTVFLTDPHILILTVIAFFAAVIFRLIKNKIVSAIVAACGFTLMIVCIVYALLLGAEFTEVLVFVLAFTLLFALTFVSSNKKIDNNSERADGGIVDEMKNVEQGSGEVYNPAEENDEAKGEML